MSSRGRSLVKLSAITVVAFGLGIAFASALDLPRPGRAEQAAPPRPPLQAQSAGVRVRNKPLQEVIQTVVAAAEEQLRGASK